MIRTPSLLLAPLLLAACAAPASPAREQVAQTSATPTASIAPSATAPPSPAPKDTAAMNNSDPLEADSPPDPPPSGPPPFEIRLRVTAGPGLEVTVRNKSSRSQRYLHDSLLQPSRLELTSPGGRAVKPFDSREIAKFDTRVRKAMFEEIGPGEEAALYEVQITPDQHGKEIYWGPYQFSNLAPGTYRARVVWQSEIDTYFDDSNARRRVRGVWKGTVTSNEVKIRVP
jgi:hypothetical protein